MVKHIFKPDTIYHGDNVEVLKTFPDACVDLIYIDPPFFTKKDWGLFSDKWHSLQVYLKFMEERIIELYRVLTATGSFYIHCDWHAGHYLKILCDEIFGYNNFRGDIIWVMGSVSGFKTRRKGWVRNHDTILYYVKSKNFTFNKYYLPYSQRYIDSYNKVDEIGKYAIWYNNKKVYLKDKLGVNISDVWVDILSFQTKSRAKERLGYPTQKPEALLERIIKASSNEGDIILDAFMGTGTALAVAKKLGRQYTGIDNNPDTIKIVKNRLKEITLNNKKEIK